MGPCPMASLRDELFRIAVEGSEEQMRKLLQDPQVNVNEKHTYSLVALHQSAEFNLDIGVTKVQSSIQKTKARYWSCFKKRGKSQANCNTLLDRVLCLPQAFRSEEKLRQ